MKKKLDVLIPYILILIASLIALHLLFLDGTYLGDDSIFHFGQTYDIYEQIKDGILFPNCNRYISYQLGYNALIFYAPIPHYIVALTAVIFGWCGLSLLGSFKLWIFLSGYISAIFMYKLLLKMTKKKTASIIGASFFILYPYRLFNYFLRTAFSEAFVYLGVVIFVYGIYLIINEEAKVKSFITLIIGFALTLLSHNITAIYLVCFEIIYLLFNVKKVFKCLKQRNFIVYSVISVVLMLGITSFYYVGALEHLSMNYYQVSNQAVMGTLKESLKYQTTRSYIYTGFISGVFNYFSKEKFILDIINILMNISIIYLLRIILGKERYGILLTYIIGIVLAFISLYMMDYRLVGILSYVFTLCMILYNDYKKVEYNNDIRLYKSPDLYFLSLMIIILIVMIYKEFIWDYVPSIFRNIQFPWRLWGFVQLYSSILVSLVISKIKFKELLVFVGTAVCAVLPLSSQALGEQLYKYNNERNTFETEIDSSYATNPISTGWQKEYVPYVFYNTYDVKYKNGLYYQVRYLLNKDYNIEEYEYVSPLLVEGEGVLEVISYETLNVELTLKLESDSVIQFALLYYKGYELDLIDSLGNETTLKAIEADGLVAFNLPKGKYYASLSFRGSSKMKVSYFITKLSYAGIIIFISYGLLINEKKYYLD